MTAFDPLVVEGLIAGTRRFRDAPEVDRRAAVYQLVDEGLEPGSIAARVRTNPVTVHRILRDRPARRTAPAAAVDAPITPPLAAGQRCVTRQLLELLGRA